MNKPIVLTTLNSRYIHSSFSLRYLYANLGTLQTQAEIKEFTIHDRAIDIVEKLLAMAPKIIGFSVYIWNVVEITAVVKLLKTIEPNLTVVLGGPEVSHIPDQPDVVELADYVIKGAGESSFRALCEKLIQDLAPENRVIQGIAQPLEELNMPYEYYNDEDLQNRIVYVEASRGCPFKCEFCLSSLDKTSKTFTLDRFLEEMDHLYRKGARNFKFIDRTFNLKVSHSTAILEFFLDRLANKDNQLMVHFEVIPDRLPDKLKAVLLKFPANSLQFEVGVQTFDPEIQSLISRRQDNEQTKANLTWLKEHTKAHIHADLIFGLPGDTLNCFASSFDQLYALKPQEIQLGILKRLRGAPINRHSEEYEMTYSPTPPYTVLKTKDISFDELQRVGRFARYWDIFGNQGRFKHTLPLIMESHKTNGPFKQFMQFTDALYAHEQSTWKISLRRQFVLLYKLLPKMLCLPTHVIFTSLQRDFDRTQPKGSLSSWVNPQEAQKINQANARQKRHL